MKRRGVLLKKLRRFPDQRLEEVVTILLRKWLAWEGLIVCRPYEKLKREFSSCGCGGSHFRGHQEGFAMKRLNLLLPGCVLRVGQSQLRRWAEDAIGNICWG